MSSKRILPETTLDTDASQRNDTLPKKARFPSSPHPQSMHTPSIPLHLPQIVDDGQSHKGFLQQGESSYLSPYIRNYITDRHNGFSSDTEFVEDCLKKLRLNDPTLLSFSLFLTRIEPFQLLGLIRALRSNSTLLELKFGSHYYSDLTEDKISMLVEALKVNTTLTRLSVQDTRSDHLGMYFSDLIRFNTTLLSLDLASTSITGLEIAQLSETLSLNTTLTHLSLHLNEIMEEAVTNLSKALTVNSTLNAIDLRWSNITENGAILLYNAPAGNPTLTRLELYGNPISSGTMERILQKLLDNRFHRIHLPRLFQNDPTLTSLILGQQRINEVQATQLSEALTVNSTLKKLDLSSNQIGTKGMASMIQALTVNLSLTRFDTSENQIRDDGLARLCGVLHVNSTLSSLLIRKNGITSVGAAHLRDILNTNLNLTMIHLGENAIGNAGATHLSEALMLNSTITSLKLPDCMIGDCGVARLCEMLNINFTLTSLNLENNRNITVLGAKFLAEALEINSTLKTLNMNENHIHDEGNISLKNALIWNQTLTSLKLNPRSDRDQVFRDKGIISKNLSLYEKLCNIIYNK